MCMPSYIQPCSMKLGWNLYQVYNFTWESHCQFIGGYDLILWLWFSTEVQVQVIGEYGGKLIVIIS